MYFYLFIYLIHVNTPNVRLHLTNGFTGEVTNSLTYIHNSFTTTWLLHEQLFSFVCTKHLQFNRAEKNCTRLKTSLWQHLWCGSTSRCPVPKFSACESQSSLQRIVKKKSQGCFTTQLTPFPFVYIPLCVENQQTQNHRVHFLFFTRLEPRKAKGT